MTQQWLPAGAAGRTMRAPVQSTEMMIDACEESAIAFWSFWGPLGDPAIQVVELLATMQRRCLALMTEPLGGLIGDTRRRSPRASTPSRADTGDTHGD